MAIIMLGIGEAGAVTISDCVDGGGVVVRCAEQPVTQRDKVVCPAPGKSTRIWCIGGFYHNLEILDWGGDSRYRAR
ncbi:hypothetical protein V7968_16400 [Nocardia vulneris]|uniref:hypothetical protein n=1 Tax=Nocardia vulneris TaxID=1141657 RepID=UPI0030CBE2BB